MSRKGVVDCIKIFVEKVCEACEEPYVGDVYTTWLLGYLVRNLYEFRIDDERSGDVVVYEVCGGRYPFRDVFDFVVREGPFIAWGTYMIGAYVEVSICSWDEEECVNLYLNDIRKVERDELPIVGV
jgi:hypothetical protein